RDGTTDLPCQQLSSRIIANQRRKPVELQQRARTRRPSGRELPANRVSALQLRRPGGRELRRQRRVHEQRGLPRSYVTRQRELAVLRELRGLVARQVSDTHADSPRRGP